MPRVCKRHCTLTKPIVRCGRSFRAQDIPSPKEKEQVSTLWEESCGCCMGSTEACWTTDDVHTYDPDQKIWTKVETSGERGFASAVTGNNILMFGGQSATESDHVEGGTFCLNTETLIWEEIGMFNGGSGPTPRACCASTSFSSAGGIDGMLVFGGKLQTGALCNGLFFYDVVGCAN